MILIDILEEVEILEEPQEPGEYIVLWLNTKINSEKGSIYGDFFGGDWEAANKCFYEQTDLLILNGKIYVGPSRINPDWDWADKVQLVRYKEEDDSCEVVKEFQPLNK